jgi:hypothetical protein
MSTSISKVFGIVEDVSKSEAEKIKDPKSLYNFLKNFTDTSNYVLPLASNAAEKILAKDPQTLQAVEPTIGKAWDFVDDIEKSNSKLGSNLTKIQKDWERENSVLGKLGAKAQDIYGKGKDALGKAVGAVGDAGKAAAGAVGGAGKAVGGALGKAAGAAKGAVTPSARPWEDPEYRAAQGHKVAGPGPHAPEPKSDKSLPFGDKNATSITKALKKPGEKGGKDFDVYGKTMAAPVPAALQQPKAGAPKPAAAAAPVPGSTGTQKFQTKAKGSPEPKGTTGKPDYKNMSIDDLRAAGFFPSEDELDQKIKSLGKSTSSRAQEPPAHDDFGGGASFDDEPEAKPAARKTGPMAAPHQAPAKMVVPGDKEKTGTSWGALGQASANGGIDAALAEPDKKSKRGEDPISMDSPFFSANRPPSGDVHDRPENQPGGAQFKRAAAHRDQVKDNPFVHGHDGFKAVDDKPPTPAKGSAWAPAQQAVGDMDAALKAKGNAPDAAPSTAAAQSPQKQPETPPAVDALAALQKKVDDKQKGSTAASSGGTKHKSSPKKPQQGGSEEDKKKKADADKQKAAAAGRKRAAGVMGANGSPAGKRKVRRISGAPSSKQAA